MTADREPTTPPPSTIENTIGPVYFSNWTPDSYGSLTASKPSFSSPSPIPGAPLSVFEHTTTTRSAYYFPNSTASQANNALYYINDEIKIDRATRKQDTRYIAIHQAVRNGSYLVLIFCAVSAVSNTMGEQIVHPIVIALLTIGAVTFILMANAAKKAEEE